MTRRNRFWQKVLIWISAGLVLAALVWAAIAVASAPEAEIVEIALDAPTPLRVGQTATCRVRIRTPWFSRPERPRLSLPDSIQVADPPSRTFAALAPKSWHWALRLSLQPLQTGELDPGLAEFNLQSPLRTEGEPLAVQLPQLSVRARPDDEVAEVIVAEAVPPRPPARSLRDRALRLALVCAALLLAALLATLLARRRRARGVEAPQTRVPAAGETALGALQALEDRMPMGAAEFTLELTDILRGYVEARFHIRAAEQTTPEFLRSVSRSPQIRAAHRKALSAFMETADTIKFARGRASQEELGGFLRQARGFITGTAAVSPGSEAADEAPADTDDGGGAP